MTSSASAGSATSSSSSSGGMPMITLGPILAMGAAAAAFAYGAMLGGDKSGRCWGGLTHTCIILWIPSAAELWREGHVSSFEKS